MRYYMYRHIRLDKNEVFYVGIGTRTNQDISCNTYSRATANHIDNSIWLAIVAKSDWKWEIICESDTREEIEKKEKEFIKYYGRKFNNTGTLANFTLGGEKNEGYKHTELTKEKISNSLKGRPGRRLGIPHTKETKEKLSNIHKVLANTEESKEYRRKIALGNSYNLGNKYSEESKRKMSISAKQRPCNAIKVKCVLIDKYTKKEWHAESIAELSKIIPISLSTISRMSQGIKVSSKINHRYDFIKK